MMRKTLGLGVCAILATLSSAAFAEGKIVISNWDGYMPKELLENFTKETGIAAEMTVHATNEAHMDRWEIIQHKSAKVRFGPEDLLQQFAQSRTSDEGSHKAPRYDGSMGNATPVAQSVRGSTALPPVFPPAN